MRTVNDPFGGNDPLVDKLVGNAFPTVKAVADNLDHVKFLTTNMGVVVTAANAINSLPAAIASQGSAAASATAASLSQATATANATTAVAQATTATAQAGIAISQAGTATTQATVAIAASTSASTSAAAAAASAVNAVNRTPVQIGSITVLGTYNATTNIPVLTNNGVVGGVAGVAGSGYMVTVGGTVAADAIGVVAPADFIVNTGGTHWSRAPLSTIYGSMATQNASNVQIAGGVSTFNSFSIQNLGSVDAYRVIPGSDGSEVTTDAYGAVIRKWDASGNLFMAGSVIVENGLTIGAAGIVGNGFTLAASGITGPAVADIVTMQPVATPGLTGLLIVDAFGAMGMIIDPTGSFLTGSNSFGSLKTVAGLSGPDINTNALWGALISNLGTTLPASSGVMWLNAGVPQLS